MALYRYVYQSFWRDEKVLTDFTPDERLVLLFLLTNGNTTQIGLYKILIKEIAFMTGFSEETIQIILDRFENKYKIIKYNKKTHEVALVNWAKYNLNKLGGKPAMDCIRSELKRVEDKSLLKVILEYITKEEIRKLYIDTIGQSKEVKEKGEEAHGYRKTKGKNESLYEKPTEDQIRRAKEL